MPHVSIVESSDGSYYTGSTFDLERRLWEHNNGLGANFTAKLTGSSRLVVNPGFVS